MSNYMKKALCLILVISLLCSFFTVAAKNEENIKIYSFESFDGFVTNDTQAFFDVSGSSDVIAVEVGEKNKALMINKRNLLDSSLTRAFDVSGGDVILQFDMKIEGSRFPWELSLKSKNGKSLTAIKDEGEGILYTGDGARYGSLLRNKWVNIAILYTPAVSRYSVLIDKKTVLNNWILTDRSFDTPASIRFDMKPFEGEDSKVYIDNFRVYSGKKLQNDNFFPKKKYNEDSIKYQETVVSEDNSILHLDDFCSESGYASQKENLIERRFEDGNGYIHMEELPTGTTDCHFDFISGLGTQYNVVYSVDMRSSKYSGSISFFNLKLKPDNAVCDMLSIKSGGSLTLYSGTEIARLSRNKWYNISIAADFLKKEFDVYLDYEMIAENIPLKVKTGTFPSNLRFRLSGKTNNDLDLDNFIVYHGKDVRNIVDESTVSGLVSDIQPANYWELNEKTEEKIGNKLVYYSNNATTSVNGEKIKNDPDGSFFEDDINYVPIAKTAERLEKKITVDGNKYTYNDVSVTVGEDILMSNGSKVKLSAPVVEKDGVAYAPADAFSQKGLLGEDAVSSSRALVAFGFDTLSNELESELVNFMHYERPKAEDILAAFKESGMENVHPRILLDQNDFERVKNTINTDAKAKEMFEKIKIKYRDLNFPPMTYLLQDGDRLLPVAEDVLERVLILSFIYRITGETKYAERAYEEMVAGANFPDWHPKHFLDTARMAQALSLGYDWLYDYMNEEQKSVVENGLVKLGMREYLRRYTMHEWWADDVANWSPICNSGAIMTAVALMDKYPEEAAQMLEVSVKGLENALYSFGPIGAYHESFGYWEETLTCIQLLMQTLETTFGNTFGLSTAMGLDRTIDWARAMAYKDMNFSYADSGGVNVSLKILNAMWMGYYYNKPEYQALRFDAIEKGFTGELSNDLYDLMWYKPEFLEKNDINSIELDSSYSGIEIGSTRSSFADDALLLLYKGGTARNKGHEHMDSGTFSLFQDGICWANDFGYDNYNGKGYWEYTDKSTPNRWGYYRTHTQGHNCIVINPDEDVNPQDWMAMSELIKFETKEKGSIGVVDLSEAYAHKASSYKRGYMLNDDRRSVTIRDEMVLPGNNNEIYWFMHTGISGEENFEINGNSMVITHPSGEKLYLEFTTNAPKYELYTMESEFLPSFKNPGENMRANPGKKVVIKLTGGGNINLSVKLYDNDLQGMLPTVSDSMIDEWTIPDGECKKSPVLSELYIDGVMSESLGENLREYNIDIYQDKEFPKVTANAEGETIVDIKEIPVDEKNMSYKIKVTDKNDPGFFSNYTVNFTKIPYTYERFDEYIRIYPTEITASRVPEPHNPPQQVNDGNFETRFAVDGDNEWVQLDYGKVVEADAYAIAYYKGTERISYYDILISEDGINYTTIFEGQTSGETDYFELFKTGKIKLRYLKLVGHQTSAGAWNSPTEIALLVERGE